MVYRKTRYLILTNTNINVPADLQAAYKAAYEKRSRLHGASGSSADFNQGYTKALGELRKEHLRFIEQSGYFK
jgi:hypothetical protein